MTIFYSSSLVRQETAQHSVPKEHRDKYALSPWESTRTAVVGLPPVGTACAFLSIFLGLELIPRKWRYLVPPTSTPEGHNANRWAAGERSKIKFVLQSKGV